MFEILIIRYTIQTIRNCINMELEISHFAYGVEQINSKSFISLIARAVGTLDHNIRRLLNRDHHQVCHLLSVHVKTVIHLNLQSCLGVPRAYPLGFSKGELDMRTIWLDQTIVSHGQTKIGFC